jgi:hypothetical protein
MRRQLTTTLAIATTLTLAMPTLATAATVVGGGSDGTDDRVTGHTYVRHDGGTDETIELCNSTDPEDFGNLTQNNEPFSVVSPTNPALVIAGWNDYCSGWMGLGFSTDGGETWTNSLVPSYAGDTSTEGQATPEFGRTNEASDPVGAFNADGTKFYFGAISYNGLAGPKTNSDIWVARYDVLDPSAPTFASYPLDFLGITRLDRGPAAANFFGRFQDKEMFEVDRAAGSPHEGNVYGCWTKFPGFGESRIYFAHSTNEGATFSKKIQIGQRFAGQGCDIAVESDGDVYVIWRDFELSSSKKNFGISFVRSSDGGRTFSKPRKIADLNQYLPFDTARDCGDGAEECPSGFVFARVPLEPRVTSDPTGALPGVYAVVQATDPATVTESDTSYFSTNTPGEVGRGVVFVYRSVDDGRTWTGPYRVTSAATGHQIFPDADALDGKLAVLWQDSRTDPCYSLQLPIGNDTDATKCAEGVVNAFVSVSDDGTTFGPTTKVSSVGNNPQYEMFAARQVPFYGDYNWIQLIDLDPDVAESALFGYTSWTDNRDVVAGPDPREDVQDGFDVSQCLNDPDDPDANTCPNSGGLDQNIYGSSISIP